MLSMRMEYFVVSRRLEMQHGRTIRFSQRAQARVADLYRSATGSLT